MSALDTTRRRQIMNAMHGQGASTIEQISARITPADPHAGPHRIAPLVWWLCQRGFLIKSTRADVYVTPRLRRWT